MHKFTGAGWEGIGDPKDSTKFVPAALDKLDYFSSRLAQNGVLRLVAYVSLQGGPRNKDRVTGFDELMKQGGDTYGVINWAEDVQDLMIEQVVNLLQHRNPYTGKTYAQDPALCSLNCRTRMTFSFIPRTRRIRIFRRMPGCCGSAFRPVAGDQIWFAGKAGGGVGGSALHKGEKIDGDTIAVQPNPWSASDQHLPSLRRGAANASASWITPPSSSTRKSSAFTTNL